jgi:hypothetical protein
LHDLRPAVREVILQFGPDIKKGQAGVDKTAIEANQFEKHTFPGFKGSVNRRQFLYADNGSGEKLYRKSYLGLQYCFPVFFIKKGSKTSNF